MIVTGRSVFQVNDINWSYRSRGRAPRVQIKIIDKTEVTIGR